MPNQNSKISLDFRHHKDSRRGVLKYFLIYDIAPPPLITETLRFTTQQLNNVLSNVVVCMLLTCKLASRPLLLQLSNFKKLFLFEYIINTAPLHRVVDPKVPIMLRSPWISLDSFCPQLNNIKKVLAQTILES